MSGLDSSQVVLIIAAMAFMLTVALAVVTIGLTKQRLDAARSSGSKGKAAGSSAGSVNGDSTIRGQRSTRSRNLQRFSTRMPVEDLMNENSARATKSSSDPGALDLPAPIDQAKEEPPAASNEDSESCESRESSDSNYNNNKSSGSTGPVRGSVFFLHESDVPSSSAVDCVSKVNQQAAAAE